MKTFTLLSALAFLALPLHAQTMGTSPNDSGDTTIEATPNTSTQSTAAIHGTAPSASPTPSVPHHPKKHKVTVPTAPQ